MSERIDAPASRPALSGRAPPHEEGEAGSAPPDGLSAGKPPHLDRLSVLWRRLNEHKIVQWSVAYVALAYGIQHGVILTSESLEWPAMVARATMLLLALGLPLVVTFAWYHGARASRNFTQAELSIVAVLLVLSSLLFYVFVRPAEERVAPAAQQAGVTAARNAAADPHSAISVAVLPFVNLSSDKEQEFFSDGMTEEITTALAKIPDLRVVARESAFQYKGEKNDMRAVGQALNATHLITGSVRKAGDRVRITAQLVKADDGVNIWTENYDRELNDVFAIQEDIARAIATSLRMPLGLKPGETLVANRAVDVEVYQEFLRLRARARVLNANRIVAELLPEFEKLVARAPNFAPAWAFLSGLYPAAGAPIDRTIWTRPPEASRPLLQPILDKAEKAAREAIRLDPRQALAYANLSFTEMNRKRWAAAEELLHKALELDPYDPDVLFGNADFLLQTGRIKDSVRAHQQVHALEPLVPRYGMGLANVLMADNQADAAIPLLEGIRGGGNILHSALLAQAYAMTGRFDDAANTILLINRNTFGDTQAVEQAARLIRSASAKARTPSAVPALHGRLDFVYAYAGVPERLLDYPERMLQTGDLGVNAWFARNYAPARKTARFKTLVRNAGLVDYWKAKGWPDVCHPVGADDFACE